MDDLSYWDGSIPWVTPKDMKSHVIADSKVRVTEKALKETTLPIVPANSVLLVIRGMILARRVPVAMTIVPATINQDMKAIVPDGGIKPAFLTFLLESANEAFVPLIEEAGHGTKRLPTERWRQISFAFPAKDEQSVIAAVLERETAGIDALIAKKQRLIALLQEKRAALISHAVTKGLDSKTPMKDSGVAWLGEVPVHWEVVNFRRLISRIEQGWSPMAEDRPADEDEWAVTKLGAVFRGSFFPNQHKALPEGLVPNNPLIAMMGDLLITRSNTQKLVGAVCVVDDTREKLILCDLIYRLSLDEERTVNRFYCYFLQSDHGRHQIMRDARGTSNTMVKISQEHIRDWLVPVPPMSEQIAIVEYLNSATNQIEAILL